MIALERLTYRYHPAGKDLPTTVFEDFTWEAARGDSWVILGPSGCGKTTLLYLLAGLRLPSAGRVCLDGQPLARPRPQTGLILQEYGLLPWATVRQNIELGFKLRTFYGPDGTHAPRLSQAGKLQAAQDVEVWIERLGLKDIQRKYPGQISGGQRQRTAIARTLALQPDVLLMDEPFASLDAPTREDLQSLTLELWAEKGLTLVVVTHSIEEAAILGKKILLLGPPPNRQAQVVENPQGGSAGFRERAAYFELCSQLSHLLRREVEQA